MYPKMWSDLVEYYLQFATPISLVKANADRLRSL